MRRDCKELSPNHPRMIAGPSRGIAMQCKLTVPSQDSTSVLPNVTVEFYGMPRARAGRKELQVSAATVADALAAVAATAPGLADLRQPDGRLSPQYLLSLD